METRITAAQLAKSLSDVLNRVIYRRENFLIERSGTAIATLSPAGPITGLTWEQLAAHLRDIPMPGDGFADDLEAIQSSQPLAVSLAWHD